MLGEMNLKHRVASHFRRLFRPPGDSLLRVQEPVLHGRENHRSNSPQPKNNNERKADRKSGDRITSVNIGLTGKCNLRCIMCSAGHSLHFSGLSRPHTELSDLAFERLLAALGDVDVVSISGRGELLLATNLPEKLKRIRKASPRARLLLTTNGTLLRGKAFIEQILEQIDALHISANGIHSSYDAIMHGGRFERLLENMEEIAAVAKRYEHFNELAVGYVIMRQNVEHISKAAHIYRDIGFDGIIYRELSVCDERLREESIRYDTRLLEKAKKEIQAAESCAEPNRFWVSSLDLFPAQSSAAESWRTRFKKGNSPLISKCGRPWTEFLVDEEGNVLICCIRNTRIGNLNESAFLGIWNCDEAVRYREGLINGKPYKHCRNCRVLYPDEKEHYENMINKRF